MTASYLVMLRPTQWLKNLMLFFPPFLGGQLLQPGLAAKGILPVAAFCLASSAGYLMNDIVDRERDACHPQKNRRPIPSGAVSIWKAGIIAGALFITSFAMSLQVSLVFTAILLGYVVLSASYSLFFKSLPVVDLFCIALGFVLRLMAGGEAFHVVITPWLFLSVFLLAVFLSTGKRLCEYRLLGDDAGEHRKSLQRYPPGFLDGTMYMTGGVVLVTYSMYALARPKLLYSVPLCAFGLLRYIFRIQSGQSGDPTESLLKDRILFAVGLLWTLMVSWSVYW
jgi:4-hydroxybenzoate polyprenyltransferase